MEIRSLKALEKHLKEQIDDVLRDEVAKTVKQTEQSAIYDVVYGAYGSLATNEPKEYRRRYDKKGGLASIQNMESGVVAGMLHVTNNTPFDDGYNTDNHGIGLDELVEYGDGGGGFSYEWPVGTNTFGDFYSPRPFTEETIDRLDATGDHIESLKNGLRRRGIHVK